MRERRLDWLLRIKSFLVLVTLGFSIQHITWCWIGESLSLKISKNTQSKITSFSSLLPRSTVLSDIRAADHPILKFTQDRKIFRVLLIVGVILGVVAGSETGTSTNPTQILDLRIASVVVFLFLTLVQALQTAILATSPASGTHEI